jgi:hypothetical protein
MDSRPSDEMLFLAVAERDMGAFRTPDAHRVLGFALTGTVLAAMAGAALTLGARDNLANGDLASNLALSVSVAAYATLGALIVRRGRQPHRLDHAGRGRGPGVSRDRLGIRGDRARDVPRVAPGG